MNSRIALPDQNNSARAARANSRWNWRGERSKSNHITLSPAIDSPAFSCHRNIPSCHRRHCWSCKSHCLPAGRSVPLPVCVIAVSDFLRSCRARGQGQARIPWRSWIFRCYWYHRWHMCRFCALLGRKQSCTGMSIHVNKCPGDFWRPSQVHKRSGKVASIDTWFPGMWLQLNTSEDRTASAETARKLNHRGWSSSSYWRQHTSASAQHCSA